MAKTTTNFYQRIRNAYNRKGVKGFLSTVFYKIKLYFFQRPYWTLMHHIHSNFRARRIPSFTFQGKKYNYLYSKKNFTWRNERSAEVPIVIDLVKDVDPSSVLEIGNVLRQYYPIGHDIVDKYEMGPGVRNEDIIGFAPNKLYKRIVSMGTMEHIGYDFPEEKDPTKIPRAVEVQKKLLAPGGILYMSMPMGYNPNLDKLVAEDKLGIPVYFMKRLSKDNEWREAKYEEVKDSRYGYPFPASNGIYIGIYKN
ncbi:MAG: hypothetical protein AAB536_00190 [Patescibacteria group bacterium]